MRRVTSFCVLVASMLILIQGARSEHAFRQNDRPPNAVERDADKYNRPQVFTKLSLNPQDQDGMCPIKTDAGVESAKTTKKVADLTGVPLSHNRQDVGQSSIRIHRREDTDTRDIVRQSTARRYRRNVTGTRDAVCTDMRHSRRATGTRYVFRKITARRHRRSDTGTRYVVRQITARRHRRSDTGTRDVVRQITARRHRRSDTGTRDVVRQSIARKHRWSDTGTRDVFRQITARRHRRSNTGTRDVVRQNTARKHRRSDNEFRYVTATSAQGRSIRLSRREMHRFRRNRNTNKRHQDTEALRQGVSDLDSPPVPRLLVGERGHRPDVRRRIRYDTKRARKSIRRDVAQKFESVRISVPRDSHTASVNGLFTMQTNKRRQRHYGYHRSSRRVVRRARQTRGYRRISSHVSLEMPNNKYNFFFGRIDDIDERILGMKNVEKSSNNWKYEMTQSNLTIQSDIVLEGVSSEQIETKGKNVNIKDNQANTKSYHAMSQRQKRRSSRAVTKRSVKNKSRLFESLQSNTRVVAHHESNARRQHRRSARSNLTFMQQKTRRFMHRSNDAITRRSDRTKLVDKRNSVSDSSQGRGIRNKRLQHRDRSTRGVRRIVRATEVRHSRSRRSVVYRSVPGDDQVKDVTSQYRYLIRETPKQTRSRRNSVSGRRRREFRSRHGRRGLEDKTISQYEHYEPYTIRDNINVPATDYSSRNSRTAIRRMTGSRRDNRRSDRRRSLQSISPKALIATTKFLEAQHPDVTGGGALTVDESPVSISTKYAFTKHPGSGTLDHFLNYLLLWIKAYPNNRQPNDRSLSRTTTQVTDSCARGVILGVVAILSTQAVQKVSAPHLSLGRIRQSLLA